MNADLKRPALKVTGPTPASSGSSRETPLESREARFRDLSGADRMRSDMGNADVERIVDDLGPLAPDAAAYLTTLVEGMLTRPRAPDLPVETAPSADEVADMIADFGFAQWDQPYGWVQRSGFVMPARHIRHDLLLHFLGMLPVDAEDQGLVRMSQSGWQCLYRITPAQRRALTKRGYEVDDQAERMKKPWHGLPPYEASVHPARRLPR